jgi:hydroxypyruvate isomerase
MDRRRFLEITGSSLAVASLSGVLPRKGFAQAAPAPAAPKGDAAQGAAPQDAPPPTPRKGRIRHSVCRWCYGGIKLEELCKNAVAMGISSIEILNEEEWTTVKKFGLTCAMPLGPGGIPVGWNRLENHDALVKKSEELLPKIAAAGLPNMIVFSGNKQGQSDSEGIANCATGLKRITPLAEKHGVTLALEYLNSKVDHGDYAFDHMRYGAEVCQKVGSDRMKILYDIYHAQIMEGDVIRTIRDHKQIICHYHTGGVPGRNEIDETQELNYTAVCRAIAETGFKGYVAQEFVPKRDPMTSLRQAIDICDV